MLVVLPLYDNTFLHNLQRTLRLFFLSLSKNFPSHAGNPKNLQTGPLAFSIGRNSVTELLLAMIHYQIVNMRKHGLLSFGQHLHMRNVIAIKQHVLSLSR